jgi:hypothetical protein
MDGPESPDFIVDESVVDSGPGISKGRIYTFRSCLFFIGYCKMLKVILLVISFFFARFLA